MAISDDSDDMIELERQKSNRKKAKDDHDISVLEDFLSKDDFTKADLYGEVLGNEEEKKKIKEADQKSLMGKKKNDNSTNKSKAPRVLRDN